MCKWGLGSADVNVMRLHRHENISNGLTPARTPYQSRGVDQDLGLQYRLRHRQTCRLIQATAMIAVATKMIGGIIASIRTTKNTNGVSNSRETECPMMAESARVIAVDRREMNEIITVTVSIQ